MVRTKADSSGVKVCAAKAPRKIVSSGAGSSGASPCRSGSSKDRYSGGNPYNPQPIPNWQKGISTFFKSESSKLNDESNENEKESSEGAHSGSSPRKSAESSKSNQSPPQGEPSSLSQGESSSSLAKNGIISDDDD